MPFHDRDRNRDAGDPPKRIQFSFAGRVTILFGVILTLMAVLSIAAARLPIPPWLGFVLVLLSGLAVGTWSIHRITRPLTRTLKGLKSGISSFGDRDFSVRLAATRNDELGEIARLYNVAGRILQEERQEVRQKELLLSTALNRSPVAILLVSPLDRVIYSNLEARRLLLGGAKLEGRLFTEIRDGCPDSMKEILTSNTDGLFSVRTEERIESYYLAQRVFQLNRQRHLLILLQRITHELGRQEAEAWKKVIRVVCHELNNAIAPLSSLLYSAKKVAGEPDPSRRFEEIYGVIHERLDHLRQFIEGYARFARLPSPRKEQVSWDVLLECLNDFGPVRVQGGLPVKRGHFDLSQMQQMLVNLVKNALEAATGEPDIEVCVQQANQGGVYLQVLDRGHGMDEETMKKAVLPFYSTKKAGSGLGLPLCREIVEGHGGRMDLQAREGGGTVVTCWIPDFTG